MSRVLVEDRTSHHPDAVVIACDANFQPYASFLAWQLAVAHPDRAFDIVVSSTEPLLPLELLSDLGVRHVAIDTADAFGGFPMDSRRSLATYLWLVLPRALDYRRILALDADILHERGDVGRLFGLDLGSHAVAAVRDNKQWRTPTRRVREFRKLGWPAAPYFNAGLALVDSAEFEDQAIFDRCRDFASESLAGLGRDQALINCVLRGDWAELSPVWNWQYTWASSWLTAMVDPNLVHFIGPAKPWRDVEGNIPWRYTAAYGAFLSAWFPDAEQATGLSERRVPRAATSRRSLLRHWRTATMMERYLARFATDETVLDARTGSAVQASA